MSLNLEELEQENFDVDDFIDRVTWKAISGIRVNVTANKTQSSSASTNAGTVDLTQLCASFDNALQQLETHRSLVERRLQEGSEAQRVEERKLDDKLQRIKTDSWHKVNNTFQQLGKRVNGVSSSVTQLTEQIEALNGPISRLADARSIVEHFTRFLNDVPVDLNEMKGAIKKLTASADTHLKLYAVVQDLPNEADFEPLKRRVHDRCVAIEQLLVEEFKKAYTDGNTQQMRTLASCLSSFKSFSQTDKSVETFVNERVGNLQLTDGLFERALVTCRQTEPTVRAVFSAPESVMQTLVERIYSTSLNAYVSAKLSSARPKVERRSDSQPNDRRGEIPNANANTNANEHQVESYLQTLKALYSEALQIESALQNLSTLRGSSERAQLSRLTRRLFYERYLAMYLHDELEFLDRRFASMTGAFYERINHSKRGMAGSGGFLETVGSIFIKPSQQSVSLSVAMGAQQAASGKTNSLARGNPHSGKQPNNPFDDTIGGTQRKDYSILLSEELCVTMIHDVKQAVARCRTLSTPADFGENLKSIFDRLIQALLVEHVQYAVEFTLQCVAKADDPDPSCLELVRAANVIVCHFERLFESDCIATLSATASDKLHSAYTSKRAALERIEMRVGETLERFLQIVIIHVRTLLKDQRTVDFRPENDGSGTTTPTCLRVCEFIVRINRRIEATLDGKNREVFGHELGSRFHRCIVDHFYTFQYNAAGGVSAICDCSEYRDAMRPLKSTAVDHLFETLHALLQLLVVPVENVAVTVQNDQLSAIEKSIILAVIERRVDYKKVKLSASFR